MGPKSRFQGGAQEYVTQFVREAIRAGRWTAGEAMDVTALAAELQVSPSPVREALARLRGEGILGTRHRDGYSLPLLQAHELAGEYRLLGLTVRELAVHVAGPTNLSRPRLPTYAGRMEAVLISLALAADLQPAALQLHQSALRIHSYLMAEPFVIQSAEGNLKEIEDLATAGGGGKLQALLDEHFSTCVGQATSIARHVFEQSKRFEKAFE